MMPNKWRTVSSEIIFKHPRITLLEDIVELPSGSQVPYLKFDATHDAATVICIRGDQVLLQREYSYPPNEVLYQFPGGKIESGETPEAGIARELIEEAGLKAKQLKELGWFYIDNRRSSVKMHVFLATNPTETEQLGGDAEEDITSHWLPIDKVNTMIKNGEIRNYSVLAGWAFYKASL